MEAAAAAFALIGTIVEMAQKARTASAEEHSAILAGFSAAAQALKDAQAAAHAARAEESTATAAAIAAAKKPSSP